MKQALKKIGTCRIAGRASRRASRIRGIALIEALIALLIFMLGVLGMVGMQASMTRAQTDSKARADAAYLAGELIGRMWGDLTNMASYDGSGCASQTRCKEWQTKVSQALPRGTGAVTVNSGNGDVQVTVSWTLPNGESHQYVTSTTIAKAGT